MFIALVGTPAAGKRDVQRYLLNKGFKALELPNAASEPSTPTAEIETCPDGDRMLEYATANWQDSFVTTSLRTYAELEPFLKRPFFLVVAVDGPIRLRFDRAVQQQRSLTLESFIEEHDDLLHAPDSDLARVLSVANVRVNNTGGDLTAYLDKVNLLDEERLRPGWDLYFMTLASLASHRSNCMKRRVGAVLVRSKRIISTGYNGTPRGTLNCNKGGCSRCNGPAKGGQGRGFMPWELLTEVDACLCLHAEENALLEAGRERIGGDAVIYCNTCPCLLCSVKIVQCGVREVVYNQSYSMDEASAKVLEEGGVVLRKLDMPNI